MKHMKTVTIPAKTEQHVDFTTCDMCGCKVKRGGYEVDEVCVSRRQGSSYPEGGIGTEVAVDLCGDCFSDKLLPWLESHGAKPATTEWDY